MDYGGALFVGVCMVTIFSVLSIWECIYRQKNKDTDPFISNSLPGPGADEHRTLSQRAVR